MELVSKIKEQSKINMAVEQFAPGSMGLLAPIQYLLEDTNVSEILINKPQEVFFEKNGIMHRLDIPILDALHLKRLFTFIANENGQVLNEKSPLLSGNLYDGTRVQLVIEPAAKDFTLSIRRPTIQHYTLEDYSKTNFFSSTKKFNLENQLDKQNTDSEIELKKLYHHAQWAEFVALAVTMKKNIIIAGETSSGKTTFLNACTAYIPKNERIITLEDTFEIKIPHENVVNLLAIKKTESQKNIISMQDLVQCALRLRPDRLIMGEIRGREILDFISACSTGHAGSITSIHANSPKIAFMRMVQLYKLNNVPSMRDEDIYRELHEVIDLIIQVAKTPVGRIATNIYYKYGVLT